MKNEDREACMDIVRALQNRNVETMISGVVRFMNVHGLKAPHELVSEIPCDENMPVRERQMRKRL